MEAATGKRIREIDLLKCFGIILVVYCHISLPAYSYFSLFHIAIFIMASGMLFNPKKFETKEGIKQFWKNKFLHLYLPYFIVNIIFLLLNNLFIQIKLYPTSIIPGIVDYEWFLQAPYSGKEIFLNILKTFFTIFFTQMGEPSWFIAVLIWIEGIYFLFSLLFSRFKFMRERPWIEVVIEFFLFFQIMFLFVITKDIAFPREVNWAFIFGYCFALGRVFRLIYDRFKPKWWIKLIIAVVSGLGLYVLNSMGQVGIWSCIITDPIFFTLSSVLGWCLAFYGCSLLCYLPEVVTKPFSYIGSKTIWIMCLHFICFKLVTLIYIKKDGLPMEYWGAFPTLPLNGHIHLGLIYLFAGLALPIALAALYDLLVYLIKKAIKRFRKPNNETVEQQ